MRFLLKEGSPSIDASNEASVRFSMEQIGEVGICMHASISDGRSTLIRGISLGMVVEIHIKISIS